MASTFAKALARLAEREFDEYGTLHETHPAMQRRIKGYWDEINLDFTTVSVPWSAVFVSSRVKGQEPFPRNSSLPQLIQNSSSQRRRMRQTALECFGLFLSTSMRRKLATSFKTIGAETSLPSRMQRPTTLTCPIPRSSLKRVPMAQADMCALSVATKATRWETALFVSRFLV